MRESQFNTFISSFGHLDSTLVESVKTAYSIIFESIKPYRPKINEYDPPEIDINYIKNMDLYHGTYRRYIPSILKYGLGANTGQVYLSNDVDDAMSFVELSDSGYMDYALLKISLNGLNGKVRQDATHIDDDDVLNFIYDGIIPPENLMIWHI